MKKIIYLIVLLKITNSVLSQEVSSQRKINKSISSFPKAACTEVKEINLQLGGIPGKYVEAVKNNWIKKLPYTNPGILNMFAIRDVEPYRNYVAWSGEFAGKYLTGATEILRLTNDTQLKSILTDFVNKLVSLQDTADGYLGPFPKKDRLTGWSSVSNQETWEQWSHGHIIVGLLKWYGLTGDNSALQCAIKIGDLMYNRFMNTGMVHEGYRYNTEENQGILYGLALLYRKTKKQQYLHLADKIIKEFEGYDRDNIQAGNYINQALNGNEFYLTPRPRWESLVVLQGIGELYYATGNKSYLTTLQHFWWSIAKTDRHNNGGFSSGEGAIGNPYDPAPIETCCTVAWIAMTFDMLRFTGNSIVADELEMSTLNQVLGYQSPDGLWCTYNTPMDGKRVPSAKDIGFQIKPDTEEINCCSANAPRGFGMISEWALMEDNDGFILNWYGHSTIQAKYKNNAVLFKQTTNYPADDVIMLEVSPEQSQAFTLKLRVPYWSANSSVKVNGNNINNVVPGKYLSINRQWKAGDKIEIKLDLSLRYWRGTAQYTGKSSIYRGPLLLVREDEYASVNFLPSNVWQNEGDRKVSDAVSSVAECYFVGTGVVIEGVKFPDGGIIRIEIDNKLYAEVDVYSEKESNFEWVRSGLNNGEHYLKILILDKRNTKSIGNKVGISRIRIDKRVPKSGMYQQGDSYVVLREHPVMLDANSLEQQIKLIAPGNDSQVKIQLISGRDTVILRDYGTAGLEGKSYKSWLNVQNTKTVDFSKSNPGRIWRPSQKTIKAKE